MQNVQISVAAPLLAGPVRPLAAPGGAEVKAGEQASFAALVSGLIGTIQAATGEPSAAGPARDEAEAAVPEADDERPEDPGAHDHLEQALTLVEPISEPPEVVSAAAFRPVEAPALPGASQHDNTQESRLEYVVKSLNLIVSPVEYIVGLSQPGINAIHGAPGPGAVGHSGLVKTFPVFAPPPSTALYLAHKTAEVLQDAAPVSGDAPRDQATYVSLTPVTGLPEEPESQDGTSAISHQKGSTSEGDLRSGDSRLVADRTEAQPAPARNTLPYQPKTHLALQEIEASNPPPSRVRHSNLTSPPVTDKTTAIAPAAGKSSGADIAPAAPPHSESSQAAAALLASGRVAHVSDEIAARPEYLLRGQEGTEVGSETPPAFTAGKAEMREEDGRMGDGRKMQAESETLIDGTRKIYIMPSGKTETETAEMELAPIPAPDASPEISVENQDRPQLVPKPDATLRPNLGEGVKCEITAVGELAQKPESPAVESRDFNPIPIISRELATPDLQGAQKALLPQQVPAQITQAVITSSGPVTELRLSPDELGTVRIELKTEADRVTITLLAERPETLDLLRRHSDRLIAEFRSAGFSEMSLGFGNLGDGDQAASQQTGRPLPPGQAHASLAGPPEEAAPPVSGLGASASLYLRL